MLNTQTAKMRHRIDDRGFTFVELLIVIGIFSIGILAVASMQVTSINANSSARISGEATVLAANQIEELIASDYDTDADLNPGAHTLDKGAYTIDWVVTDSDIDSDGTNDSKTILVTVRCANPNAKDVQVQYIIHEL
ncbi:MAG: prepilin-type N-terminal cleavage/methylation domain-containing protein [Desulfobacterales bacterium]|jgi:type IV pilus assembly protein PilV